jgi:hypothetical protein
MMACTLASDSQRTRLKVVTAWRQAIELSIGDEDVARLVTITRSRTVMHPEPAKTKRKGSGSLEPKELGILGARIYSAASGVSLTFINPASSVVLGYNFPGCKPGEF